MMPTARFADEDIFLSQDEARKVLQFFFGKGSVPSPGGITQSDRAYAQELLVEAVNASELLARVEALWRATAAPAPLSSVLRKLATSKAARRHISDRIREQDIRDAPIYDMVRTLIRWRHRSVWNIRLELGDDSNSAGLEQRLN